MRSVGPLVCAAGKAERRSLRVSADRPPLSGVHDLTAERENALKRRCKVGYGKVRKGEPVAWAGAALMHADCDTRMLRLPTPAFRFGPRSKVDLEQRAPESTCPFGVVGGKLDQRRRRHQLDRSRHCFCAGSADR